MKDSAEITLDTLKQKLQQHFPDAQIDIEDLTGQANHLAICLVSQAFVGHTSLARHRMVYALLPELNSGLLHAVALKTYTFDEITQAQRAT
jgi:BolA protein